MQIIIVGSIKKSDMFLMFFETKYHIKKKKHVDRFLFFFFVLINVLSVLSEHFKNIFYSFWTFLNSLCSLCTLFLLLTNVLKRKKLKI